MRICKKCGRGEFTYVAMMAHIKLCHRNMQTYYPDGSIEYNDEGKGLRHDRLEF